MFLFLSVQNEVQPNFCELCGKKVGLDDVLIQVGYKIIRKGVIIVIHHKNCCTKAPNRAFD
jgi:hypothetical protein